MEIRERPMEMSSVQITPSKGTAGECDLHKKPGKDHQKQAKHHQKFHIAAKQYQVNIKSITNIFSFPQPR